MVFTFLKAQGHEVGKSLLEEDQLDICRAYLERAEETGVEILLPTDIVVDTAFPVGRPRRRSRASYPPTRSRPTRSASTSARSRRAAFAAALADARTVFWNGPMGVFEVDAVRRGHPGRRRGADQGRRALGGRRRRLRGRRAHARLRRGRVRPHLHRRRRQPRVPRGQGAPRHPGPGGLMAMASTHPADGGELEDEPQPPGGGGPGPEAGVDARRQEARLRQGRGGRACRRSPTCARCRRSSTATGCRSGTAPRTSPTHDAGAYTGEISAAMLAKLGCSYVVVGHSERREYHAETDEVVNAKAHKALAAGMTPIVCVGEGLEVRQAGEHVAHCLAQVDGSLAGLHRRAGRRAGHRLRAGLGDRHRRGRDPGRRAGGLRGDPGADPRGPRRRARRTPYASSTAAR